VVWAKRRGKGLTSGCRHIAVVQLSGWLSCSDGLLGIVLEVYVHHAAEAGDFVESESKRSCDTILA